MRAEMDEKERYQKIQYGTTRTKGIANKDGLDIGILVACVEHAPSSLLTAHVARHGGDAAMRYRDDWVAPTSQVRASNNS